MYIVSSRLERHLMSLDSQEVNSWNDDAEGYEKHSFSKSTRATPFAEIILSHINLHFSTA